MNNINNMKREKIKFKERNARVKESGDQLENDKPRIKSTIERPQSALLRGVNVTHINDLKVNPEPITVDNQDNLIEDFISPLKLKLLTGQDDLRKITTLEIKVNTEEATLNNFGVYVPNLETLKLVQSQIHILRDLGSSLKKLKTLYMPRCELRDLDGLASFISISQLYLSYNDISDISSCSLLDNLTVLDLEGNNIDDIHQLSFLGFCQKLTTLTLEGNPICISPSKKGMVTDVTYNYRETVIDIIGNQLEILDNELIIKPDNKFPSRAVTCKIKRKIYNENKGLMNESSVSRLEEDWSLLNDLTKDGNLIEVDSNNNALNHHAYSSESRPTTSRPISSISDVHRIGSALKPSGFPVNTSSTFLSPLPSSPSSIPMSNYSDDSGIYSGCESSLLSARPAMCGNLAKALRSKKQNLHCFNESFAKNKHELMIFEKKSFEEKPEEKIINALSSLKSLDSEIETMKKEIKKSVQMVNVRKAPQVLKITHNASLSGDDDSDHNDDNDDDSTDIGTRDGNNNSKSVKSKSKYIDDDKNSPKNVDDLNYNECIKELSTNLDYNVSISDRRQSLMKAADFFVDLSNKPIDFSNFGIKTKKEEDDDEMNHWAEDEKIVAYNKNFLNMPSLPRPPNNDKFSSEYDRDELPGFSSKSNPIDPFGSFSFNKSLEMHLQRTKPNLNSFQILNSPEAKITNNRLKPLAVSTRPNMRNALKNEKSSLNNKI